MAELFEEYVSAELAVDAVEEDDVEVRVESQVGRGPLRDDDCAGHDRNVKYFGGTLAQSPKCLRGRFAG